MPRPAPDSAALLDCARRLARDLHGVEPPEAELRERIDYVLYGRKQGWANLDAVLISEVELRNLLLAHLDYECADLSDKNWGDLDPEGRATLVADLDQVLFGHPALDRP